MIYIRRRRRRRRRRIFYCYSHAQHLCSYMRCWFLLVHIRRIVKVTKQADQRKQTKKQNRRILILFVLHSIFKQIIRQTAHIKLVQFDCRHEFY